MGLWKPAIVCIVVAVICGCSKPYVLEDEEGNVLGTPEQKYAVLSFFFDGVPKPGGPAREAPGVPGGQAQAAGQTVSSRVYEHGPFAAKQCEGCHVRGSNRLIMPREKLCLNCHTLGTAKRYIHGPLNSGDCMLCHDPHSSPNPHLLISESTDFCFHCHSQNDIYVKEVHRDTHAACTECHDAHMSDNEHLLR